MARPRIRSFEEFWPFYLGQHRRRLTRTLHLIGTDAAVGAIAAAAIKRQPALLLLGLVLVYGFAWVGHFFVEHNRPATFEYPLWSLVADWKMWALTLGGRLEPELRRAGIPP